MGTIQTRTRKDGSKSYTATVRVKQSGKVILSLSETFARRVTAEAWIKKQEAIAAEPGGVAMLKRAGKSGKTVGDAIQTYIANWNGEMGKTKAQVLRTIMRDELADLDCSDANSEAVVAFAQRLLAERKPQTVQNYLSHLQAVFAIARPAWGIPLDPQAIKDAVTVCRRLGVVTKSQPRLRRPTVEEMDRLMQFFYDRHHRGRALPMHKVIAFALFSTRRLEEITLLEWADLEPGRILVRDMKHPGEKAGNHVWADLPPEAERVIETMSREYARIFPYSTDAITASFTRTCALLGIKDLHFHDLRHEGVSRLFEMGWTIPRVATVSGHRSWQSLQRYTHLRQVGDKWAGWEWLDKLEPQEPLKRHGGKNAGRVSVAGATT